MMLDNEGNRSGQSLLGNGWSFPVAPRRGRLSLSSGRDKIQQSIWLILSTTPGERQMLPEFGCGIHELLFQANTAALRGQVREKVLQALVRFEPRVDVTDVRVSADASQRNRLDISIDYRLRSNNAFFNLVFPFYLDEGPAQN